MPSSIQHPANIWVIISLCQSVRQSLSLPSSPSSPYYPFFSWGEFSNFSGSAFYNIIATKLGGEGSTKCEIEINVLFERVGWPAIWRCVLSGLFYFITRHSTVPFCGLESFSPQKFTIGGEMSYRQLSIYCKCPNKTLLLNKYFASW